VCAHADARELTLPIRAEILEIEIAEGDTGNAPRSGELERFGHERGVRVVRARRGQEHLVQREPHRLRLRVEDAFSNRVHGDAAVLCCERRQQPGDLESFFAPKHVERPRAVFAAAPREQDFWLRGHAASYHGASGESLGYRGKRSDEMPKDLWCVYILRCADGTLYTGITNDVDGRLAAHNSGKGAKYTASRSPVTLAYVTHVADRSAASRLERKIKRLARSKKLALIASNTAVDVDSALFGR